MTLEGFLVVDKPAGISSHDVVSQVRRRLGIRRVGHTGTLDPFATGVLPVAVGEATKAIQFLDEGVKEYQAVMRLGQITDSQDCTGNLLEEREWQHISENNLRALSALLCGRQLQVPPMFSAVKRGGIPLYRLARRGEDVPRESRQIEIFTLEITDVDLPLVSFTVRCSRGTYVRTLAHDWGCRLGCGAHLVRLRRTRSGPFGLERAVTVEELLDPEKFDLMASRVMSVNQVLGHLKWCMLTVTGRKKVKNGVIPADCDLDDPLPALAAGERVRLLHDGRLIAVAEADILKGGETLRLLRVFG